MEITIRSIREKDYSQIVELFLEFETFEKLPEKMINSVDRMNKEKDFFNCFVAETTDNYFVIEDSQSIIGAGGINYGFDNGGTVRISRDIIHPNKRGKGIGTKLTKYRIDEIKRNPNVL